MIARAQLFSFRVLLHLYPAYRAFPARNPLFSTIRNSYVAFRAAHALVLAALTADVVEIHRELRARRTAEAREALTTTKAEVDPNGSAETRRSLSRGSAHHAVVPSLQIHEFPDGGWCQPGTETQLLAKDRASGNVVWQGSSDGATDLSLVSVSDFTASPWTTSTVQTMVAPLQVVHDAQCSAAPMLRLGLNTVASGNLSIGTVNVGTTLTAIQTFPSTTVPGRPSRLRPCTKLGKPNTTHLHTASITASSTCVGGSRPSLLHWHIHH
jgi:hypothetical protein